MKYLKIEENKGYFNRLDEAISNWVEIDQISKDDLLVLLDKAMTEDFEMDDYDEALIAHKAHQIVYKSVHEKFNNLIGNKSTFIDDRDSQFAAALDKYESSDEEE